MSELIAQGKKTLRKEYLAERKKITESDKAEWSDLVCRQLADLSEVSTAEYIGAYVTDGSEVDLTALIELALKNEQRVIVPRYNGSDVSGGYEMVLLTDPSTQLKLGHYNIPEPLPELPAVDLKKLDNVVWLVPGVVFDPQCGRLGRGKGIYDQLLKNNGGISIGIFFDCQRCDEVPMDSHDYRLNMIVTESSVYRTSLA